MDKTNNELLEAELKRQLNCLKDVEAGSQEAKAIVDDLLELSKIAAEQQKIELESTKLEGERKLNELKLKQAEEQFALDQKAKELDRKEAKKKRVWDHILQGVGIGVPVLITVIGELAINRRLGQVLTFEQTGEYVASSAGKSLLNSAFRRK